jgi:two-component system response regulator FixJ
MPYQSIFVVDDRASSKSPIDEYLSEVGHIEGVFASPEIFYVHYRPGMRGCLVLKCLAAPKRALDLQQKIVERSWPFNSIFIIDPDDARTAVTAMKLGASDILFAPVCRDSMVKAIRAIQLKADVQRGEFLRVMQLQARVKTLSSRELEVMTHLVAGLQTKAIAGKLNIAPRTVKAHRMNIRTKLEAPSTAVVIRIGMEIGLYRHDGAAGSGPAGSASQKA